MSSTTSSVDWSKQLRKSQYEQEVYEYKRLEMAILEQIHKQDKLDKELKKTSRRSRSAARRSRSAALRKRASKTLKSVAKALPLRKQVKLQKLKKDMGKYISKNPEVVGDHGEVNL